VVGGYSDDVTHASGCLNGFGTAASVEVSISQNVGVGGLLVYSDENCNTQETTISSSGGGIATCFTGTINSVLYNP
jgi:hypothetical protein